MSTKHLSKGDALPPTKPDVLRIYSMRFCPYAQRTRLALAHKQIPHESVNVHLKNKPEWFTERNPRGLVPVLEINDQIVYESAICNEYLDEVYADNGPLLPKDPYQRARIRIQMDDCAKIITLFFKIVFARGTPEELDTAAKTMHDQLQNLEEDLQGKFFGGDQPGALDFHLWPWIERSCIFNMSGREMIPADRFPKLTQWTKDMMECPAVQADYIGPEHHVAYAKSHINGTPDYDMDLSKPAPQ